MSKLYVIVDATLSKAHRAVQAAHGVAEYCLKYPDTVWRNHTIVMLKDDDINRWVDWAEAVWREPYWDNKVTCCVAFGKDEPSKECDLM
jgi:hypothetical protein